MPGVLVFCAIAGAAPKPANKVAATSDRLRDFNFIVFLYFY
jgi:hypothetical protein